MQRNYGFVVATLDEREYILSAVTHGIRNNWINALKTAANLNSLPEPDNGNKPVKEAAAKVSDDSSTAADLKPLSRRSTADSIILTTTTSLPTTAGYIKTSIDAGGNLATRLRSESGGGGGVLAPVSPPLTRTPTSRVKKEKSSSGRLGGSGLRSSMKGSNSDPTASMSVAASSGQEKTTSLLIQEERAETSMIPERDTGMVKIIFSVFLEFVLGKKNKFHFEFFYILKMLLGTIADLYLRF